MSKDTPSLPVSKKIQEMILSQIKSKIDTWDVDSQFLRIYEEYMLEKVLELIIDDDVDFKTAINMAESTANDKAVIEWSQKRIQERFNRER